MSFTTTYFVWRFQDEIHFQIMRPIYNEQLAHEKNVTTKWWEWTEGMGWDEEVEYVKNLALVPPSTAMSAGCTDTRRLGGNFFLVITGC